MEERIFLEADIDEHGLEAVLDVFHAALVDAADDVAVAGPLDRVFLEYAVFEQRDALFEFFGTDDKLVAGLAWSHPEHFFDAFGHGNEFGSKFLKHWGG